MYRLSKQTSQSTIIPTVKSRYLMPRESKRKDTYREQKRNINKDLIKGESNKEDIVKRNINKLKEIEENIKLKNDELSKLERSQKTKRREIRSIHNEVC